MTIREFQAQPQRILDKYQTIKKTLDDGRIMLVGFERKKKSSRFYKIKVLLNPPVILTEIVDAHRKAHAAQQ